MSVLIVGSVALDSVKTPFGEVSSALGGSATYASVASSFFCVPHIIGVVGEDFPQEYISLLDNRGIDVKGLEVVKGKTFHWSGYYEYDLNTAHTLDTQLNVFQEFSPKLPESHKSIPYVFLANIDPDLQLSVLDQVKSPKLTVCDTMNFWIQNKKASLLKVLKSVDIVLLNDGEARELCETPNLLKASRMILDMGPKWVIVKKGEHGAIMVSEKGIFSAPAYPLEIIFDPTGAGDSFAGGLIGYLSQQDEITDEKIRQAIIYGSAIASFNVESFSLDRLREISIEDIEDRFEEFRRISIF